MAGMNSSVALWAKRSSVLIAVLAIALTLPLLAPTSVAAASDGWHEEFTKNDAVSSFWGQYQRCQTFTPLTTHTLNTVSFILYKVGSPTFTVTISLQPTLNHVPTGGILRSTTFSAASLTTTAAWYAYTFAAGYDVQAYTEYALVLSGDGGDSTNYVSTRYNTSGGYSRGLRAHSADGGASWTTTTQDYAFKEGQNRAPGGWYEQFTTSNAAGSLYSQYWRCQTFTPQTAHYLNTISFVLYKVGSPSFTVTISLQPTLNHIPTGAILCSTTCNTSSLTTTAAWHTYTSTTGYNVQADTEYALVLSGDGGDSTNYVAMRYNTSGGYSRGLRAHSADSGAIWTTTTQDYAFAKGQNPAPDNWYEQFTSSNAPSGLFVGRPRAQTFTPQDTHYVNTVAFSLYKVGSPTFTVTVTLQPTLNQIPTGEILCSTTFSSSSLTTAATWRIYSLATGYNTQAGTEYALVLSGDGGDTTNYVAMSYNTTGGYSRGLRVYSQDGGTTWVTTTQDYAFREGQNPLRTGWCEQFTTSDEVGGLYGQNWRCQTFTPEATHYMNAVSFNLNKAGSLLKYFTVTITLKRADENHEPTGDPLCATSFSTLSLIFGARWYTFSFATGYNVQANTEYALVLSGNGGDSSSYVTMCYDTVGGYSRGLRAYSRDAGTTWVTTAQDYAFKEGRF